MDDNLSISAKRKEEYKNAWPHGSVFYKRFILGLWVAADGLCYQQFADNVRDYLIGPDWLEDNQIMYAVIGVDFGGTKSAHSFTLTGFTKGFKQVEMCIRDRAAARRLFLQRRQRNVSDSVTGF